MPLHPGDDAPDWTLMAVIDDVVTETSLSRLVAGRSALILTTYPLDFTGPCGSQLCRFKDAYPELLRANIEVASMSVDSPYSHLAWSRAIGIPFPMISDFNRAVLPQYDALDPGTMFLRNVARRTAFVIDRSLVVRYSWYAPAEGGLPPVDSIIRAAQLACRRLMHKTCVETG